MDFSSVLPKPDPTGGAAAKRLTVRDLFAAHALTGIIAGYAADGGSLPDDAKAAKWAYGYADAMIAARDGKPVG